MSKSAHKHAGLSFPFADDPTAGKGNKVCEGIAWHRIPLPFALDHVNCWLLGEPGNQVLVDTGVDDSATRKLWQTQLASLPLHKGVPVPEQLLVTHFHPDHMGLAGWFAAAGSALLGSNVETDFAHALWNIEGQYYAEFYAEWYAANGLPDAAIDAVKSNANTYKMKVHEPPPQSGWAPLQAGQIIDLGGHEYEVLIGRGHAPDMVMLYRASDHVLIAADQVLPSITPNVSVMPRLPDNNPLASFLDTLESLRQLPEDTLVLPSHGAPFTGLHAKLEGLTHHHDLRLAEVLAACSEPCSAFELFAVLFGRELDAQQTSFALGESLAHLHFLEQQGELDRTQIDGTTRFVRS